MGECPESVMLIERERRMVCVFRVDVHGAAALRRQPS